MHSIEQLCAEIHRNGAVNADLHRQLVGRDEELSKLSTECRELKQRVDQLEGLNAATARESFFLEPPCTVARLTLAFQ